MGAVLVLLAAGSAAAQQATLQTLHKAEDEDLIVFPWSLAVEDIEDMNVQGRDGAPYGEVDDVLVDHTGAIRAIVIDYGRVLGPEDRQAIVPIERLSPKDGDNLVLDMTAQELQALPDWNG
jgi:sporulation protein YlmC with PRC-barrel domain